jgi:hypothetical protein
MKLYLKMIAAMATTALFVSCSDDDSSKIEEGTTGNAEVFFDNGVAGDALVLGTSYTNSNNETLIINRLNYIVSNFVLVKSDGTEYTYPKENSYFVISQEGAVQTVHLENIPAGDYKQIKFGIGVDNQRYLQGETAQQSFWDLATQYDLTWTWSTGYKFILFEGEFTAPGVEGQLPFQVHQGSNTATDNYRTVTLDLPTTARIRQGDEPSIHLKTNVNVLLDGDAKIKLQDNLNPAKTSAAIMGGQNLIDIANNSVKMFAVDHVHNGAGGEHED